MGNSSWKKSYRELSVGGRQQAIFSELVPELPAEVCYQFVTNCEAIDNLREHYHTKYDLHVRATVICYQLRRKCVGLDGFHRYMK